MNGRLIMVLLVCAVARIMTPCWVDEARWVGLTRWGRLDVRLTGISTEPEGADGGGRGSAKGVAVWDGGGVVTVAEVGGVCVEQWR